MVGIFRCPCNNAMMHTFKTCFCHCHQFKTIDEAQEPSTQNSGGVQVNKYTIAVMARSMIARRKCQFCKTTVELKFMDKIGPKQFLCVDKSACWSRRKREMEMGQEQAS
jgi:hypothetical protein